LLHVPVDGPKSIQNFKDMRAGVADGQIVARALPWVVIDDSQPVYRLS
jgi:hypothetical protein